MKQKKPYRLFYKYSIFFFFGGGGCPSLFSLFIRLMLNIVLPSKLGKITIAQRLVGIFDLSIHKI